MNLKMKLIFFYYFSICGLVYGQNKICRPIKITQYQGEDTTLTRMYEIGYENDKISKITHHEFTKLPNTKSITYWNFIRNQDVTWVVADKDTLFKFNYDAKGRMVKVKPKHGFLDYVYSYNKKGEIDSMRTKVNGMEKYEDVYKKFNYETSKEATFLFKDGLSVNYKGVSTFDDKKNPFYPNLELCIVLNSPYFLYFTKHNTLKTYLLTHIGSIIVYQDEWTYNTENYPISQINSTLSYDLKEYIFQSKFIYEYECK